MSGASEAIVSAARTRLSFVQGLSQVSDGPPLQAVAPYAMLEAGAEGDWSHKSGVGREIRLAVTIRDRGERPERLRRLLSAAEGALEGMSGNVSGWRIVSFVFLRGRTAADGEGGWIGIIDYRARLLAMPEG